VELLDYTPWSSHNPLILDIVVPKCQEEEEEVSDRM